MEQARSAHDKAKKLALLALVVAVMVGLNLVPMAFAQSGSWTQTSQADFGAGTLTDVDVATSPGDVMLAFSDSLDQLQDVSNAYTSVYDDYYRGQTFRPAVSGRLTRIVLRVLRIGNPSDLVVELRNRVSGGLPGTTIYATAQVSASQISDGSYSGVTFAFAAPYAVTAGADYAFVVHQQGDGGNSSNYYRVSRQTSNVYGRGNYFYSNNSGGWWTALSYDMRFAAYVGAYETAGNLVSSVHDAGDLLASWGSISWDDTTPGSTNVRFRVATSDAPSGPWSYVGPDGGSGSYYTSSGAALWGGHGDDRYIRYRAYLTGDGTASPQLHEVTIAYNVTVPTSTPTSTPEDTSLYRAFAFGADTWTRASPNSGTNYIKVSQSTGQNFTYSAPQGHGYVDTADIDTTANNRGEFTGNEEIYDQHIMANGSPGDRIVFRVDLPNGYYRFVAAGGDADYGSRSTTLTIQDGASGGEVTLVSNYVTPDPRHYWTVTFGSMVVPPAEGGWPDPVFHPQPSSPWLEVTSGYILVNQIIGSGGNSYGGVLNLLEIWTLNSFETPTPTATFTPTSTPTATPTATPPPPDLAEYDNFQICPLEGLTPPEPVRPPLLRECVSVLSNADFEPTGAFPPWVTGTGLADVYAHGGYSCDRDGRANFGFSMFFRCDRYHTYPYTPLFPWAYQEFTVPSIISSTEPVTIEMRLSLYYGVPPQYHPELGPYQGTLGRALDELAVSVTEVDGTPLTTASAAVSQGDLSTSRRGRFFPFYYDLATLFDSGDPLEDHVGETLRLRFDAPNVDNDSDGEVDGDSEFYIDQVRCEICSTVRPPEYITGQARRLGGYLQVLVYGNPTPMQGINVWAIQLPDGGDPPPGGWGFYTTYSIHDSTYNFFNVNPGEYRIYAEVWVTGVLYSASTTVTIGDGDTDTTLNMTLG